MLLNRFFALDRQTSTVTEHDGIKPPLGRLTAQRKLGGGLLLFVAWLGVIGPVFSIGLNGFFALRWEAMYPEAASYYRSWSFWWFISVREGARIIAAIVLVSRRSADAVWFTILVLWLSGPVLVTLTWMLSHRIVMPSALVRSGTIAAAASLYLLRSRQVRTVYGFGNEAAAYTVGQPSA